MRIYNSLVIFIFISAYLLSCQTISQSSSGAFKDLKSPYDFKIRQMTYQGVNTQGRPNASGTSLFYISTDRTSGSHSQVYELDLETKKETRWTFQYGEIHQVLPISPTEIIYTSSTDELKENPDFIRKSLIASGASLPPEGGAKNPFGQSLPRTEIYQMNRTTNKITRLTERAGFDGFISIHPKRRELVYSLWDGEFFQLMSLNLQTSSQILISRQSYDIDASHSADGLRLAWVRWSPSNNRSEILIGTMYAKNPIPVIGGDAIYRSPSWSRDGEWLIFSANRDDFTNYEIYMVRNDGTCLTRLTYHAGRDENPHFHPTKNVVYFQSQRDAASQIYELDLSPLPSCNKSPGPLQ